MGLSIITFGYFSFFFVWFTLQPYLRNKNKNKRKWRIKCNI